jgi:hypothetical protein
MAVLLLSFDGRKNRGSSELPLTLERTSLGMCHSVQLFAVARLKRSKFNNVPILHEIRMCCHFRAAQNAKSYAFSAHASARPIPTVTAIVVGSVKSIDGRLSDGNSDERSIPLETSGAELEPAIAADNESDGDSPVADAMD